MKIGPRHDKTNKMVVRPAHEEILGLQLPIERTAKTLIRLGGFVLVREERERVASNLIGYFRVCGGGGGAVITGDVF